MMEGVPEAMITEDASMVDGGKGLHDSGATQCCMGMTAWSQWETLLRKQGRWDQVE